MATNFIRRGRPQRADSGLRSCKNVRILSAVCTTWQLTSFYVRSEDELTDSTDEIHGHVNSISVLRSYRRLGLAKKLMLLSRESPPSLRPGHSDNM